MKAPLASSPRCCVVYTTDPAYLFPTLVSAMQARRHSSPAKADIIIFCLNLDNLATDIFEPICAAENIGLVPISSEMVEGQSAMLARLFVNRFVPEQYSQYLYLDGDVHVLGSLDPLLEVEVTEGQMLAANDPITFLLDDKDRQSRDLSRHLISIGLSAAQAKRYFNSGVLRICRQGWDTIGLQAWKHYRDYCSNATNAGPSRFPDQDALNLAAIGRCMPISLAWNFPVFMRNIRVEAQIEPRIMHFMSSPKPWHGAFPPWTDESCLPYRKALTQYPAVAAYNMPMALRGRAAYHLKQRGKRVMELLTWGLGERRERVLAYEASCVL